VRPAGKRRLHCYGDAMTEILFLVEPDPEGGFVARAFGHSIFTQAESEAELREMVREAVQCHFEDEERPKLIQLHFVRNDVIAA
jgi:predicted RNase H-like HicB family nuclease